jgi:hypothetical protein
MSSQLKYTKENVALRRGKVLELSAQGYNQTEIAKALNVSEPLISIDMQFIRAQAKEAIREYIDEKLPQEYNLCLVGLGAILKESWILSSNTNNVGDKIRALSLAKECYDAKLDLLTNVDVVEDIIRFINKDKARKEQLVSVTSSGNIAGTSKGEEQEPSPLEEEPIQEPSEEE